MRRDSYRSSFGTSFVLCLAAWAAMGCGGSNVADSGNVGGGGASTTGSETTATGQGASGGKGETVSGTTTTSGGHATTSTHSSTAGTGGSTSTTTGVGGIMGSTSGSGMTTTGTSMSGQTSGSGMTSGGPGSTGASGLTSTSSAGGGGASSTSGVGGGCNAPNTQCDDGCVDLNNDAQNCGNCDNACTAPANATASCLSRTCGFDCDTNFHECASTTTCAADSDATQCGTNCVVCTVPAHGSASCTGGACGIVCTAPYVAQGSACQPPPPRPISPMSATFATSRFPTLTWALPNGFTDVNVDVCKDRACTNVLFTALVTGTGTTVTTELPQGIVYWRLFTNDAGVESTISSPVWEMELSGMPGTPTPAVTSSWGSVPDFNGDGFAELIVSAGGGGPMQGLTVYPGGASNLGMPVNVGSNLFGNTPLIGDFDGDGFPDLVAGNSDPRNPSNIAIYAGSATGVSTSTTWSISTNGGGGPGNGCFTQGDLNGDGYADIIAVVGSPQDINGNSYIEFDVYYGSATGPSPTPQKFTSTVFANLMGGGRGGGCDSGDVNADGFADIIVANPAGGGGGGTVTTSTGLVFLGTSSGINLTPTALNQGNGGVNVAAIGDVNGDGFSDVMVNGDVYLGSAAGIVTLATATLPVNGGGFGFSGSPTPAAGDLDGDGYGDIVTASNTAPYIIVFPGSATGPSAGSSHTFAPPAPVGFTLAGANNGNTIAGALADINGDGFPDIGSTVEWQSATQGNLYQMFVFPGGSPLQTTPNTTLAIGQVNFVR